MTTMEIIIMTLHVCIHLYYQAANKKSTDETILLFMCAMARDGGN